MLVVLSDLHFVDATAGDHNVSPAAFRTVLLSEILSLARANRAREIEIVLLGDVFDVVRSEKWLEANGQPFPARERPWGEGGLADTLRVRPFSPTEERCLDILGRMPTDGHRDSVPPDTILHRNWHSLELFRQFPEIARRRLDRDLPVRIVYVPGNHDRLVSVYPRLRDEVARILGLPAAPGADKRSHPRNAFPFHYVNEAYGVVARHGHQFDPWNYGRRDDLSDAAHREAVLGDVFAVEFAVKIPWLLQSMRGRWGNSTDAVIESLREMHNVRPTGHVLEWLRQHVAHGMHVQVRRALDAGVSTAIKGLFDIELVHGFHGVDRRWDVLLAAMTRRGLRNLARRAVDVLPTEGLLPYLVERTAQDTARIDRYARAACHEPLLSHGRARYVVYGHTHAPREQPLGGRAGQEAFYINTGTWRDRIFSTMAYDGHPTFARLHQLTYAVFYRGDEDVDGKRPGTVSFEVHSSTRRKERLGVAPVFT